MLGRHISRSTNTTGTTYRCSSAGDRVEINSNCVENVISPVASDRKNALLSGHDQGGAAWDRIASPIETAKVKHVDLFAHLKDTLEAIANAHPRSHIDQPLPWGIKPTRTEIELKCDQPLSNASNPYLSSPNSTRPSTATP